MDRKIYSIEFEFYECCVVKDGENYLQDVYFNFGLEDSMVEFLWNVEFENLDMYIQFCECVIDLDDKIKNEELKMMDFFGQIFEQSLMNDVFYNVDMYNMD